MYYLLYSNKRTLFLLACMSFGLWMSAKANPTNPEAQAAFSQGRSLMETRSYPQAVESLNRAVYMAPSDIDARRMLGLALIRSERFNEAAQIYLDVTKMTGSDAMDRYWLGEAYLHANRRNEAAAALAEAVRMDPQLSIAHGRLAETYMANKDMEKAKQACTDGISNCRDAQVRGQLASLLKVVSKPTNLPAMLDRIDRSVKEQPQGGFKK